MVAKRLLLACAAVLAVAPAPATTLEPPVVHYDVRFPNAAHHEARIVARFETRDKAPLRIEMARSSPGRYAIHEFAKNVYSVSAIDGQGRPLKVTRSDPYGWTVSGHDGVVHFGYTLYADRGDGTYSQIDASHAHLNMPATFAYAPALDGPVAVRFHLPDPSWKVATQLNALDNSTYYVGSRQYFMDSPVEIGPLRFRQWAAPEAGNNYKVRIAFHSADSDADLTRFADMAEKVYREQVRIWGDIPGYDYGTYTFLADYVAHASGDGMEHRNSTYLVDEQSLKDGKFGHIETLSHELFHSWNVERLRPRELEPFDFSRANPSPSLWLAEGFTSYYGPLAVRRAGVRGIDSYLDDLGRTLSGILNASGRQFGGPAEMSLRAPFVDAATSIDPANPNIFTSYYPYGAMIALALDLQLRDRAMPDTLDGYMRLLWKTHGVTEKPYTQDDLRRLLGQFTADTAFADRFFAQSIDGSALPDLAPLLARAGLTLRPRNPGKGWVGGLSAKMVDGNATVSRSPAPNSPLYAAGIDSGDVLVKIDGAAITSEALAIGWTRSLVPGKPVTLQIRRRSGKVESVTVTPRADPALEIVRNEKIGLRFDAAQRAFRDDWLGKEGSMLPK